MDNYFWDGKDHWQTGEEIDCSLRVGDGDTGIFVATNCISLGDPI